MEFWDSKHSSEPGCDRISSSWQPAQSCILLLGQGKHTKLSSGPLISQQNWIPERRLPPFASMQSQRQLKYCLMYFGTTELPHSHKQNSQVFLPHLRQCFCFSPWYFCTHPIPYSPYPCHCLISVLQNTWGWRRSPRALGSPDPSPQLRAGLAAKSSVQFWTRRDPKERDSTYKNHGTELFKQENGLNSFFINITSKSNSSTCKKDNT